MSTTKLFRAGMIATVGVAGITLAANAQSRYGNVYDYESGRNCGQSCAPAPVPATTSRYGAPVVAAPTYNPAPVYVDCVTAGTCAPQPATVYTQPAPVYTQPATTYTQPATTYTQSTQLTPANCPAGTTAQSDGTCMQTGSSSYSSSTTYSEPSYSSSTTYSAPATTYSEPANCPAGTTAQSDGTCMQTGSSYSSSTTYSEPSYSGSTYSGSTYSSSSSLGSVSCPAGTTAQPDGTCMQGGTNAYAGSSIELYTGDAATTSSYGSYGSSQTYSSPDYLPIRK